MGSVSVKPPSLLVHMPCGQVIPRLDAGAGGLPANYLPDSLDRSVSIRAVPPDPSNVVALCTRADGGPTRVVHATPDRRDRGGGAEWFQVDLPTINNGRALDYRFELRRLGQCLATLPADGSWVKLIEGEPATSQPTGDQPSPPEVTAAGPRWEYQLTFFGSSATDLRAEVIGPTPSGFRLNFLSTGGRLVGPQIDAIEQAGTDYVCVRPDGMAMLEARVTWQNADGAIIYEQASGMTDLGPDGYAQVQSPSWSGTPPVVMAPTWSTGHPAWQWLNRCQGLAVGRTLTNHLRAETDFYLPEVGARRRHD
jgi:hypothetical protein